MQHFLIYTNYHKDKDFEVSKNIRNLLLQKGQKCSILSEKAMAIVKQENGLENASANSGQNEQVKESREGFVEGIPEDVDCMIVLGGDGTVLQAAREVKNRKIPMIGINMGTLGYLTEVDPCNLEKSLELLMEGQYDIESRMMICGKVQAEDGRYIFEDYALNDIVVSRSGSLQIIKLNIYVNGQFLKEYCADGIIVTTPTGSTGYNLSAGGPIVKPGSRVLMITPVSPHSLINRSIILSPEDVIEIEIPGGREGKIQNVEVYFDGNKPQILSTGQKVRICVADRTTDLISLNRISFLDILHRKMKEADEK